MKFSYEQYGDILRPVIPVVISNGKKSVECLALVDSGADACLFDSETGKSVGIDVDNSEVHRVVGVGGKISHYYSHPVILKVGRLSFKTDAGFMPGVMGGFMPYGFVGQKGFFDAFIVKFDKRKNQVELKSRS
jgi:hypothetical protein